MTPIPLNLFSQSRHLYFLARIRSSSPTFTKLKPGPEHIPYSPSSQSFLNILHARNEKNFWKQLKISNLIWIGLHYLLKNVLIDHNRSSFGCSNSSGCHPIAVIFN